MEEIEVSVKVQPVSYRLLIGTGLMGTIAQELSRKKNWKRYAIITDQTVSRLWAEPLEEALFKEGLSFERFVFPAGEASKNRATKEKLENAMMEKGFERDGCVIALGGGVVGDLAGFTAATYMRGLPLVMVPTTVLSMADASIGGKTAVDTPYGKNLIGAFHHPAMVFMDMQTLSSLDERSYRAGFGEILKHGFIWDPSLLDFIELHLDSLKKRDPQVLEKLFAKNCQVKNAVVSEDEKEAGLRQILNYGHTMGHAVELLEHFSLQHGECVSIGMAFACRLARVKQMCPQDWLLRQETLLRRLDLPTEVPGELSATDLIRVMKLDKKARGGQLFFVLPTGVGKVSYGVPVSEAEIHEALGR